MGGILVPLLQLASLLFFARAILSWIPIGRSSPFFPVVDVIHRVTEPVLEPVRRVMPRTGPIDLSIFAVLIFISFVLTPIAASL